MTMLPANTPNGLDNLPKDPVEAVDYWVEFGLKVNSACRKVGIPRATYYFRKKKGAASDNATPLEVNPKDSPTQTDDTRTVSGAVLNR